MLLTIITFVLILGILVFVHEFGHFISARKLGVKVEEFGFGFPPRIFGLFRAKNNKIKKIFGNKEISKRNTIYSINLLPLGGFCKIKGEDGKSIKDRDSFSSKPAWIRSIILSSGVLMNFVLAAVLLIIGFKIGLPQALDSVEGKVRDVKIQIVSIAKDSPAEKANLSLGDQITGIGQQEFSEIEDFQKKIKEKAGQEVLINIKRADQVLETKVIPRENPPQDEGALGISLVKTGIVSYSWYESIGKGILATFSVMLTIITAFYEIIHNLIIREPVAADFAGPIGIAVMTGQVARMGFVYILQFAAVLSINLGIINILPFPALDGGRILFLIIEKLRRKKIGQRIENWVHATGFILLILLMIFVTFKDVIKFKNIFLGIWEKINKIL